MKDKLRDIVEHKVCKEVEDKVFKKTIERKTESISYNYNLSVYLTRNLICKVVKFMPTTVIHSIK